MLKRIFYYITPFAILAILVLCLLVYLGSDGGMPGEAKGMLMFIALPLFLVVIVIDGVLRLIFRTRREWIWIIEAALFFVFCVVFIKA